MEFDASRMESRKELERFLNRPECLKGKTIKIKMACGSLYITVNTKDGAPAEVFSYFGHTGNCLYVCLNAICKLASVAMQSGVPPEIVVKCLRDFQCQGSSWHNGDFMRSCPDAIGQYLEYMCKEAKEERLRRGVQTCLVIPS
jgi:ribonucleoside-diphosphate reductase alpha chain